MDNGLDIDDVDKVLLLNRNCCCQIWFLVFTVSLIESLINRMAKPLFIRQSLVKKKQ